MQAEAKTAAAAANKPHKEDASKALLERALSSHSEGL
jgi:hypothetical protein